MRKTILALVLAAGALGLSATGSQAHYYGGGYYGGGYWGGPHYWNSGYGYGYGRYCFKKVFRVYDPYYGWVYRKKVVCR